MKPTVEHKRLIEHKKRKRNWTKWGPYLSERSWGTVREDYSEDGNAWDFLPHDHARSKAYRWEKTALPEFPTGINISAFPWLYGTKRTQS